MNIGLRFQPPHAVFEDADFTSDYTDIYKLKITLTAAKLRELIVVGDPPMIAPYDLIIMVGPPASTKSTYCKLLDNEVVSQDVLKTAAKCVKMCEKLLKTCSVVVDNTNATSEGRKKYIDIAKKLNKRVACVFFNIHKDISLHMNHYRTLTSDRSVPDVAIHKYYKMLEPPDISEGFSEILELDKIFIELADPLLFSYLD
jgi:bifunctional polynucleotide phosphatase/kinase